MFYCSDSHGFSNYQHVSRKMLTTCFTLHNHLKILYFSSSYMFEDTSSEKNRASIIMIYYFCGVINDNKQNDDMNILKHLLMKKAILMAMMLCLIFINIKAQQHLFPMLTLQEGQTYVSCFYGNENNFTTFGTGKADEDYDVAYRINDDNLAGTSINAFRIYFADVHNISNVKVWLSDTLQLDNNVNKPSLYSFDVANVVSGWNEVTIDKPVTMPKGGLYVGYSFTVGDAASSADKYPVVATKETSADGFYLHTSKTYKKWKNQSAIMNISSTEMIVISGGSLKPAAMALGSMDYYFVDKSNALTINLPVYNHGTSSVSSFDYSYNINGKTGSQHVELVSPLDIYYGDTATFNANVTMPDVSGTFIGSITIDKVNGIANEDAMKSSKGKFFVIDYKPVHRAVMEEYTGTWCGWCPRGLVGLEELNRLYPNSFIGISYHSVDPMAIMDKADFPSEIVGFPDAYLDRTVRTDAFLGNDMTDFNFHADKAWQKQCAVFAPFDVDVDSKWNADSILDVTATVTPAIDDDVCNYRIAFILTADSLQGEPGTKWDQDNYYPTHASSWTDPLMASFVNGTSVMPGLYFSDVIVEFSPKDGIINSITAPLSKGTPQTCSYQFDVTKALSVYDGKNLIQDKNKLNVIALVIDERNGNIVNANKARVGKSSTAAITTTLSDKEISRVLFSDMSGRRIEEPSRGFCIMTTIYKDGLKKSQKLFRR
jgi:thiol-disulfide isomerase/thioredoxin